MQDTTHGPIEISPVAGAIGAELSGVDLSRAGQKGGEDFKVVHDALMSHGVIFLRDQTLCRKDQLALAKRFGDPEVQIGPFSSAGLEVKSS